ncbi:MAG: cyclic nucleotide-binding domain-containing protein [Chitinophagales bacterium]
MIEPDPILIQSLLFQHLDTNIITEVLSKSNLRQYAPGSILIKKGTAPQALYIVRKGRVGIYIEDVQLAELGELSIMGESLIADETAIATTIALTEPELIEINKEDFYQLVLKYPRRCTVLKQSGS